MIGSYACADTYNPSLILSFLFLSLSLQRGFYYFQGFYFLLELISHGIYVLEILPKQITPYIQISFIIPESFLDTYR